MTELREVVAVDDRVKFDELVYRRDTDLSRTRDPRDYDYRHSRASPQPSFLSIKCLFYFLLFLQRKATGLSDTNHSTFMASFHDSVSFFFSSSSFFCQPHSSCRHQQLALLQTLLSLTSLQLVKHRFFSIVIEICGASKLNSNLDCSCQ